MRIIAKKSEGRWSAYFEDDPPKSYESPSAMDAIRRLLVNSPERNVTIDDFRPEFSACGLTSFVMVLDKLNNG